MDLSIIIVNYKTPELVFSCIESIEQNAPYDIDSKEIKYEIIVVDNNSRDNCFNLIKSKYSHIRLVELDENKGFGFANNRGAEVATGRNFFFLNSDTLLIDNSISKLCEYLDDNTNVGAVGGNLLNMDFSPQGSFVRLFPGMLSELSLITGNYALRVVYGKNRNWNHTSNPIRVARVSGADVMIPSTLFRKIGGFDEQYFMYEEETDLMYRLKQHGYYTVSVPQVRILHLGGGSSSSTMRQLYWGLISRAKFIQKYHSNFYFMICNVLHFCACLTIMFAGYVMRNHGLRNLWSRTSQWIFKVNGSNSYFKFKEFCKQQHYKD